MSFSSLAGLMSLQEISLPEQDGEQRRCLSSGYSRLWCLVYVFWSSYIIAIAALRIREACRINLDWGESWRINSKPTITIWNPKAERIGRQQLFAVQSGEASEGGYLGTASRSDTNE